ncbi:MAG TPA: Rieske 2Fe-2S domain-containing protein [Microcoleaceae cyanobacterium]
MDKAFNFFQQWYPLTPIEDLDPRRPTPVTVLGQRLVIWKPGNTTEYRVFIDRCPHRLAPLSEGRVDETTGNLMCSYHGWQFAVDGNCVAIPQAENPELLATPRPQLCATALPSQSAQGLLWVWMDATSPELASATALPLSDQIDAEQGFVWLSLVRDLAYDWQTLIENVADPSHVPFSHHGVQGNRNQAKPIPIKIIASTMERIEATIDRVKGKTALPFQTTITFEPPCRLEYAIKFHDGKQFGLVTYCVPTLPGKSRIVAQFPRNFGKVMHRLTPRWVEHMLIRNPVLDGDMMLLHQQEYYLQQQTGATWNTAYHLPTSADRLVIEFRRWFDKYCQGHLPWPATNLPAQINPDRRVIFDRYQQHTQICSSCKGALQRIQQIQVALLGGFAIAVALTTVLPDGSRQSIGIPLMLLALLGLGGFAWLKFYLEPRFRFVDYVHADR